MILKIYRYIRGYFTTPTVAELPVTPPPEEQRPVYRRAEEQDDIDCLGVGAVCDPRLFSRLEKRAREAEDFEKGEKERDRNE